MSCKGTITKENEVRKPNMRKKLFIILMTVMLSVQISGCSTAEVTGATDSDTELETEGTTNSDAEPETTEESITTEEPSSSESKAREALLEYYEQMDAEQLPLEKQWILAYADLVVQQADEYMERYEEDDIVDSFLERWKYNLIYLDEDDIPELAYGVRGYWVSVCTYEPAEGPEKISGELHTPIEQWGYGAGGNHGYDYLPGENVIRCYDTDYAGSVMNELYWKVNTEYEIETYRYLQMAYLDNEGNVFRGWEEDDEEKCDPQWHYYYYDGEDFSEKKEILSETYASYQWKGDFEPVAGGSNDLDALEIMEKLYQFYRTEYREE